MSSMVGTLRGMGYAAVPMVNSIVGACVFRGIWMYTFFAWNPTWFTLFLNYPISWMIISIAHFVTYQIVKKRTFKAAG